jgi:putative DNA primase/helicase
MTTFTASNNDRHPTELAMLRGARIVTAQETESGQRWAEAKIKALTGGDPISARFMRQDFFTFQPMFKLLIAGNHKPSLKSVDEAVRRRFNLIPFTVTIPAGERDPDLFEKLKQERSGILEWAIQGCLEWQRIGLAPPSVILDATNEYLDEEDAIGRFLKERCYLGDQSASEDVSDLYASYKEWCEVGGERAMSTKRFSQNLSDRKLQKGQNSKTRRALFRGVRLLERAAPKWEAEQHDHAQTKSHSTTDRFRDFS